MLKKIKPEPKEQSSRKIQQIRGTFVNQDQEIFGFFPQKMQNFRRCFVDISFVDFVQKNDAIEKNPAKLAKFIFNREKICSLSKMMQNLFF